MGVEVNNLGATGETSRVADFFLLRFERFKVARGKGR
jgi:hypothetical protein